MRRAKTATRPRLPSNTSASHNALASSIVSSSNCPPKSESLALIKDTKDTPISSLSNPARIKLKSIDYKVDGIKDKWYKYNKLGNGFFILNSKYIK